MTYMDKRGVDRLSEAECCHIFIQLTKGVKNIHQAGLVHFDIKHLNVLVTATSFESRPIVQITDFGMAVHLENDQQIIGKGGSISNLPPEVLLRQPSGRAVDIWALGVILHALLSSYLPFLGETKDDLKQAIIN